MNKPSPRQAAVFAKVLAHWRTAPGLAPYYRAQGSGERVTLVSFHRAGILARRPWRGQEGEANAAYEYRPSNDILHALGAGRRVYEALNNEIEEKEKP